MIYKCPITGRYSILYTTCAYCGRRVSLNRKNLGKNRFGHIFYYCKKCQKEKDQEELDDAELEAKFRIRIFASDHLICGYCNKEIDLNEEVAVDGLGELEKKGKKTYLYVHGFLLSHLNCISRELKEDETVD